MIDVQKWGPSPGLAQNLISISKMNDAGMHTIFE